MSRARDWDWHGRWGGIGFTVYPYQLALGISLRYWRCLYAPAFRLHIGPFKVWGYVSAKTRSAVERGEQATNQEE